MIGIKDSNRYRALEILMHAKQRHHMDSCTWSILDKAFQQLLKEVPYPTLELMEYLICIWYPNMTKRAGR